MIIIYTGEGKGKTSASVGQAIRALGHGWRVFFCQFMKRDVSAGEQQMLQKLLGEKFYAGGKGFFRNNKDKEGHRKAALDVYKWAMDCIAEADILIMDEALYALGSNLLSQKELVALLDLAEVLGAHIVLSGRGAPDWLLERADLVSEIQATKHPYEKGVPAQKGIEF